MNRYKSTQKTKKVELPTVSICRLCGMDNPEMKQIHDQNELLFLEDDLQFHLKVEICTGIKVDRFDQLPQHCCELCYDKICDFYEFRLMCTETDVQTRKLLGLPAIINTQQPPKFHIGEKVKGITLKTLENIKPKIASFKRNIEKIDMNPVVALKRLKIEDKVTIVCSICQTTFSNKEDLLGHRFIRHTPSIPKYGCSSCIFPFVELADWNSHKSWHDKSRTPFKCPRCKKTFKKYFEFSKHFQLNKCIAAPPVTVPDKICKLCKKKFLTQNLYEWHNCFIKAKASCRKCGVYYPKKQKLFQHFIACSLPFLDIPKVEVRLNQNENIKNNKVAGYSTIRAQSPIKQIKEAELIIKDEKAEYVVKEKDGDLISSPQFTENEEKIPQMNYIQAQFDVVVKQEKYDAYFETVNSNGTVAFDFQEHPNTMVSIKREKLDTSGQFEKKSTSCEMKINPFAAYHSRASRKLKNPLASRIKKKRATQLIKIKKEKCNDFPVLQIKHEPQETLEEISYLGLNPFAAIFGTNVQNSQEI